MVPEHPEVGGEPSEAEEVLSYWFPEDLVSADPETLRRHGQRWMHGGPEVDREITERFGELLEQTLDPRSCGGAKRLGNFDARSETNQWANLEG